MLIHSTPNSYLIESLKLKRVNRSEVNVVIIHFAHVFSLYMLAQTSCHNYKINRKKGALYVCITFNENLCSEEGSYIEHNISWTTTACVLLLRRMFFLSSLSWFFCFSWFFSAFLLFAWRPHSRKSHTHSLWIPSPIPPTKKYPQMKYFF